MPPFRLHPTTARAGSRLALLIGAGLAAGAPQAQVSQPDLDAAERLVIAGTNEFRVSARLAPTKPDPKLSAAARDFAAYMARTDQYGHEADGRSPPDRAQAHGYAYCAVAENIAFLMNSAGYSSEALASGALDGWKQSPQHRRNLLEPEVVDTAVAFAQSPTSQRYYAVQLFGRPRSAMLRFSVVNATDRPMRYQMAGQSFDLPPASTQTHEQCRTGALTVGSPSGGGPRIAPSDGRRYTLESTGGTQVRVREE